MHTKYVPYTQLFLCDCKFLLALRIIAEKDQPCLYIQYLHATYFL